MFLSSLRHRHRKRNHRCDFALEDKNSAAPGSGRKTNELPGTNVSPGSSFCSRQVLWIGAVVFKLSGASNSTHRRIHLPLLKQLWFAVDEVVHHDDVMAFIVVWARGNVAGFDPYRSDAGIIKRDAEEGQASIARRGRDETAE